MKNIIKTVKESNGFLTSEGKMVNKTEVHAFGIGVYHGITPMKQIPEDVLDENEDVRHEPHYAKGGFVLGETIQKVGGAAAAVIVI